MSIPLLDRRVRKREITHVESENFQATFIIQLYGWKNAKAYIPPKKPWNNLAVTAQAKDLLNPKNIVATSIKVIDINRDLFRPILSHNHPQM